MKYEMKSCPFCGNEKIEVKSEVIERVSGNDCPCSAITKVWAECTYCGATGPKRTEDAVYPEEIEASASVSWNGRISGDMLSAHDNLSKAEVKAKALIDQFFDELKKMPKPESERIGGTYYGSTQIYSSVGNMLDRVDGSYQRYDSYSGMRADYKNVYAIRVGGAYKVGESIKQLTAEIRSAVLNTPYVLLYDWGTNFSVVGIGEVC